MTTLTLNGTEYDAEAVIFMMDDDIRERLHAVGFKTDQRFVDAYVLAHANEFDGEGFTV